MAFYMAYLGLHMQAMQTIMELTPYALADLWMKQYKLSSK
jgi:hypothetical protein